jgi:hypothetical protein
MKVNRVMSVVCGGLFAGLMLATGVAGADSDPCNFNDGSQAFSYERVMACYGSVPFAEADRANALAFIRAARERSDLRENFQARYGWREKLDALATRSFASDHEFQLALVDNHKQFYNPHWRYQRPWCYTQFLASFIPFDFGSAVTTVRRGGKPEQIVFIEAAPYLAHLYQSSTGIDGNAYVGMRVLSINGVPALQYFRDYGTKVYRFDENPGAGLNEVLQNAAYSIRVSATHDVPHDRAMDIMVLESRAGERITLEVPWVFAPRSSFGFGQWPLDLSNSTGEFISLCQIQSDVSYFAGGVTAAGGTANLPAAKTSGEDEFRRELAEKRQMVQRLDHANRGRRAEFFESAPGQKAQQLNLIVPKQDGAVAYQMSDRVTVIRLDDFVQDWKDEVTAATNYACAHSDRLIFDMRNNNGGNLANIAWLTAHLLPARTASRDLLLGGRFLRSDAGRNELVERMTSWTRDILPEYDITDSCWWGYEPGCFIDPDTEQPLGEYGWTQGSTTESRGGVGQLLTRQVLFREFDPEYSQRNPIACQGKFQGKSLIVYSNGTGVSAGYFWPAMMWPDATIVTSGGIVGEPLVFGVARGGAVWGMNNFEAWIEQYLEYWYGPASQPLPFLVRDVDSFIEQPGVYQRRSTSLCIDDAARGDLHVNVWNDSRTTDAFVYGRVLNAVQGMK